MSSLHRLPGRKLPTVDTSPAAGGCLRRGVRVPRALWLLAAVTHCLCCAGAIYGFSSVAVVLARDGVFQELCDPGASKTNSVCDAQSLAIANLYAGASIASFVAPAVLGLLLDRRGPRTTMLVAVAAFTLGPLLAIAAAITRVHVLYYPAFVFFGIGASSSLIPLYNVANLFPGHEALALGVMNGSFDAGTLTFGVMLRLSNAGVSLVTILTAYIAAPVVLSWLFALLLWRDTPFPRALPPMTRSAFEGVTASGNGGAAAPVAAAAASAGSDIASEAATAGTARGDFDQQLDEQQGSQPAAGELHPPLRSDSSRRGEASVHGRGAGDSDYSRDASVVVVATAGIAMTPETRRRVTMRRTNSAGSVSGGYAAMSTLKLDADDGGGGGGGGPGGARAAGGGNGSGNGSSGGEGGTSGAGIAAAAAPGPVASTREDADAGDDAATSAPPPADGTGAGETETSLHASRQPPFDLPRLHALPLLAQLASPPYLAFTAFFAICVLRLTFYLGTAGAQFAALGDADAAMTALLGVILPLGFFVQFVVGPLIDRRGIVAAAAVVWLLAVAFSAVNLAPSLPAQLPAMLLFAAFRGFIFTTMANYMSTTFGFRHVGTLIGLVTLAGGLAGLLLSPLLVWALAQPAGFVPPNALLLGLVAAAGAFPAALLLMAARRHGRCGRWAAGGGGGGGRGGAPSLCAGGCWRAATMPEALPVPSMTPRPTSSEELGAPGTPL